MPFGNSLILFDNFVGEGTFFIGIFEDSCPGDDVLSDGSWARAVSSFF